MEFLLGLADFDLAVALAAALVGGIMTGFTGWGGVMLQMPLMVHLFGPAESLGIVVIGGFITSVQLFPNAARTGDWRGIAPVLAAIALLAPFGTFALFRLDPELFRRAIGFIVIAMTAVLATGWRYRGRRGKISGGIAGAVSGLINGFSGLGGPPLVLYLLSSDESAARQRANIILSNSLISILIIGGLAVGGGLTVEAVVIGLLIAPARILGAWMGTRLFGRAPARLFRLVSFGALFVLGAVTLLA